MKVTISIITFTDNNSDKDFIDTFQKFIVKIIYDDDDLGLYFLRKKKDHSVQYKTTLKDILEKVNWN